MKCQHCHVPIVLIGLYWEDKHGFAFCAGSPNLAHQPPALLSVLRDLVRIALG